MSSLPTGNGSPEERPPAHGPVSPRERLPVRLWRWCCRRPIIASVLGVLTLLLLIGGVVSLWVAAVISDRTPKFTISKETIYITEPIDEQGYMDYETALNDRLAKGVTPETNANVLIWQAIGPRPEPRPMLPEFYRRLGIDEPPERGDYFVSLDNYIKYKAKLSPAKLADIQKELTLATQRLWSAKDQPILADWLQRNEKPLALIIEATKRSAYYNPLVPSRKSKGPGGLLNALLVSVAKSRELANALATRAMLRTREEKFDQAWQDLLACHRLGRLVAKGATLVEGLTGLAIDQTASDADFAFLECSGLSLKKAIDCLHDLQQLPALPSMAEKIDLGERFWSLESVMLLHRYGPHFLSNERALEDPDLLFRWATAGMSLDPILHRLNLWYDSMAAAMRIQDRMARETQLDRLDDASTALRDKRGRRSFSDLNVSPFSTEAVAKKLGDILIPLFMPALHKVQDAADRAEQTQRNLHLAFALAAYHGEHGHYPMALDALAPKYLERVPNDLFTGKALIYRASENGYLLYSVGPNGEDDSGWGKDDIPPGDDLAVRIPLPERKQR